MTPDEKDFAEYYEDNYGMPLSSDWIATECAERNLNCERVYAYISQLATERAIRWDNDQCAPWNPEACDFFM